MIERLTPPLKACVHDQPRLKAWCGPTVVSSITGRPTSEIKDAIRERHGVSRAIKGTVSGDLRYALKKFGYDIELETTFDEPPTLAEWLRRRDAEAVRGTYIIHLKFGSGGHWVAVRGRKFVDTFTNGEPVFINDAPHRRKRVISVYRVWKLPEPETVKTPRTKAARDTLLRDGVELLMTSIGTECRVTNRKAFEKSILMMKAAMNKK